MVFILILPMWMNFLLRTFAWKALLANNGVLNGILGSLNLDPIRIINDLGASGKTVLTKVLLPLSMPGIISGITMVFVPAVTTFVISQILGGGKIYLIGNIIEQEFTLNGNRQLGSGLSLVMMVFILISMALLNKFDKNGEGSII